MGRRAVLNEHYSKVNGGGGVVEVDENLDWSQRRFRGEAGRLAQNTILTLVERDGRARSFHADHATKESIVAIIRENIDSHAMTDEVPT
jgi:hypothetical protein